MPCETIWSGFAWLIAVRCSAQVMQSLIELRLSLLQRPWYQSQPQPQRFSEPPRTCAIA